MFKFKDEQSIGEIVSIMPSAADIFNEFDIDYYFNGDRSLSMTVKEKDLDEKEVLEKLNAMYARVSNTHQVDYRSLSLKELTDQLIENHHSYVKRVLQEINELSKRVVRGNGPSHSNYFEIHKTLYELKVEFDEHLKHKETVLYPLIHKFSENPTDTLLDKIKEEVKAIKENYNRLQRIHEELTDITRDNCIPQNELDSYWLIFRRITELKDNLSFQAHIINNIIVKKLNMLFEPAY
ncbi:DUF542 domain-containing protein [Serpentinicella sp. ANB-PHB4]|uniref:DUF542 domain-containing protein n=1 Tax=Serpentinicella sp. ANB-PHB4 TaxID=3074076 RepID=UPI00285BFE17|nr:DUF542 domain-containing protein [Serpentinicella sp. ANB-PHB4]MDR5658384.1 DUF542 domain-containing protein [Serpentinicella sp. ANB-PHB4]